MWGKSELYLEADLFVCCLQLLDKYLQNTHAATHNQYKMEIMDIFEVNKKNEVENFHDCGNRCVCVHVCVCVCVPALGRPTLGDISGLLISGCWSFSALALEDGWGV